jgi:hypothetical protein
VLLSRGEEGDVFIFVFGRRKYRVFSLGPVARVQRRWLRGVFMLNRRFSAWL